MQTVVKYRSAVQSSQWPPLEHTSTLDTWAGLYMGWSGFHLANFFHDVNSADFEKMKSSAIFRCEWSTRLSLSSSIYRPPADTNASIFIQGCTIWWIIPRHNFGSLPFNCKKPLLCTLWVQCQRTDGVDRHELINGVDLHSKDSPIQRLKLMEKVGYLWLPFSSQKNHIVVIHDKVPCRCRNPQNCILDRKPLKPVWNPQNDGRIRQISIWNKSWGWANGMTLRGVWRWPEATHEDHGLFSADDLIPNPNHTPSCLSHVQANNISSLLVWSAVYIGVRLVFWGPHLTFLPLRCGLGHRLQLRLAQQIFGCFNFTRFYSSVSIWQWWTCVNMDLHFILQVFRMM